MKPRLLILVCMLAISAPYAHGQGNQDDPPGDDFPILRLNAEGPLSFVTSLCFSPDGETLYAGGHDKTVHVWKRRENAFVYAPDEAFRVPVGPGPQGAINAVAVSGDGRWLAVGGRGRSSSLSGFRTTGWIAPKENISGDVLLDEGMIYVFDTRTRECRLLRGHRGPVQRLAFSLGDAGDPVLVSMCQEWNQAGKPVFSLRVWDVENERSFDETRELEFDVASRPRAPKLSAIKTGRQFPGVRIFFTMERANQKSALHVWEPGRRQVQEQVGPYARSPLVSSADGRRLLVGSQGRIEECTLSNGGRLSVQPLIRNLQQTVFFEAGAGIWSGGDTAPKFAAFVAADYELYDSRKEPEQSSVRYQLWLMDVSARRFVKSRIPLWTLNGGNFREPFLAASSRGDIAVAGNNDHSIRIFHTDDLTRGNTDSRQILSATGETFEQAAFVKQKDENGEYLGLRLTRNGRNFIFDPKNQQVVAAQEGWEPDEASRNKAWQSSVKLDAEEPLSVTVTGPNEYRRTVRSEIDSRTGVPDIYTAHDICPPTERSPVPLLALAVLRNGEPFLIVYDVEHGNELRWLTGHTGRIHDVRFSSDGRFLATLSEDRTVNVWSFTDLPQHYQQHGFVSDLWLVDTDEGVKLSRPGPRGMKPGDMISSVTFEEERHEVKTRKEFFDLCHVQKPGTVAVLNTSAGQVTLKLDHAVDERKPLFTLFLRNWDAGNWSWIGWHPQGEFESSDNEIEKLVGWHYNTGRRAAPVMFTDLAQSRGEYYRHGLLYKLLSGESLIEETEEPEFSFQLLDRNGDVLPEARAYDGVLEYNYLISQLDLESGNRVVSLAIDHLDAREVESLKLTVNGQVTEQVPFELLSSDANLWQADLSRLDWTREKSVIGARLKVAHSSTVMDAAAPWVIQYYVKPPTLEPITNIKGHAAQPAFAIKARIRDVVTPASLSWIHEHEGQRTETHLRDVKPGESTTIEIRDLQLKEGMNRIRMIARNELPEEFKSLQGYEQQSETWHIQYTPAKQPLIRLADARNELLQSQIQTSEPVFRLLGTVTAPEGNTLAQISLAVSEGNRNPDPEDFQELAGLKPGSTSFELDEPIKLKLDKQRISVRAVTAANVVSTSTIEVEFRPQFPQLVEFYHIGRFLPDAPKAAIKDESQLIEGVHGQTIDLKGLLEIPERVAQNSSAIDANLISNGKPHDGAQVDIDWNTGVVSIEDVEIPIDSPTRFQLQFHAGDAKSELSQVSDTVRFLRPPRNLQLDLLKEQVAEPSAAVRVQFESVTPPEVTLKVDGSEVQLATARPVALGDGKWKLETDVPLNPDRDDQEIELIVSNKDGAAIAPHPVQTVRYLAAENNPWQNVRFQLVDQDFTTSKAEYPLQFKIFSGGLPFSEVNLFVNDEKIPLGAHSGRDPFEAGRMISLRQGKEGNSVHIEAVGAEGRGRKESRVLRINYKPEPVTIAVDSLLLSTGEVINNESDSRESGGVKFSGNIQDPYLTIRGRVSGLPGNTRNQTVKVWANGFQYDSTPLGEEGTFEVDVILGKAKGNLLQIEVPGFDQERFKKQDFTLNCEHPELKQNLHLLVVSKETPEEGHDALLERSREAFFSTPGSGMVPAFQNFGRVGDTKVLVGERAQRVKIESKLREIRNKILLHRATGRTNRKLVNDVVVVYFRGAEEFTEDGHFLYLTADEKDKKKRLDMQTIFRDNLEKIPGAHLLMLDVINKQSDQNAKRHRNVDHLGIFRVVWEDDAPEDDGQRLISSVAKALSRSLTLANVDEDVRQDYSLRSEQNVSYRSSYPFEMTDLRIGLGRPGAGPGLD